MTVYRCVCSFTGVHVVHALTASAADVAAPDKLTVAALDVSDDVCVVSSAAAHQVAAIGTGAGPVTAAPSCANDAMSPVCHAVIWRPVDEDELLFVNGGVELVPPPSLPPGAVRHLDAVLIALLQVNTDPFKSRHCLPTRLHCTGAGDAMTSTVRRHHPVNGLNDTEEEL